jgi:hypothetical protein
VHLQREWGFLRGAQTEGDQKAVGHYSAGENPAGGLRITTISFFKSFKVIVAWALDHP